MTAHDYMMHAINDIEELLGDGYAKQHPELIAAYMQTAALDLGAVIIAKETSAGLEEIACAILEIWRVQWDNEIAQAIQNIAGMLDLYSCGRPFPKIDDQ